MMAANELSKIVQNRTLMIFIFSSIIAVIFGVYSYIIGSFNENEQREIILAETQFTKSQLLEVKALVLAELNKSDVTLFNPSNVTLVVPNASGSVMTESQGRISSIANGSIVIDK
jgi:hypothetical protein